MRMSFWKQVRIYVTLATLLALVPTGTWVFAQSNLNTGRNYGPAYYNGGGTANAQTITPIPPWTALTKNMICWLPTAANTTTTPTLAVSGLTATVITKNGAAPLAAGDLSTSQINCATYDGTEFQLSPGSGSLSGSGTVNSGTANKVTCYLSTGTAVSNCPNLTDTSGGQTVTTVAAEAKFFIANQGTAQTGGNVALTNWGSGAAVSAVGGFDNIQWFTVTAGTTPSNNPTMVVTFPDTFPVTPKCDMRQIGGTGIFSDITSGTETTTSSGTLTWLGTPTSTQTYLFKLSCGS